jgi:hypothetical protein
VMTTAASTASTSATSAGGTNRGDHVGHRFARCRPTPRCREWQHSIGRDASQILLVDQVLRADFGRSQAS